MPAPRASASPAAASGWTSPGRPRTATPAAGQAVSLTADTGYFWFFDAANVEMVIKVLDGLRLQRQVLGLRRRPDQRRTTITVTDTMTGAVKTYTNPQGTAFRPIQDSSAFATCP